MKNKTSTIIFVMFLLVIGMATAYILPDTEPVVSFSSNTQQAETVAVLTIVAVDTLENAGIEKIELYQDNRLLDSKECSTSTCTFIKTIVSADSAAHTYYAKVKDFGDHIVSSSEITISFSGNNVNYPLVIELPENISFDEDSSAIIDLSDYVVDLDNAFSELSFSYSANSYIDISSSGNDAILTPSLNWNGQESINFIVTNPEGETSSDSITAIVSPVNDAPVLDYITDKQIDENSTLNFAISASDVDSSNLTFSASNLPSGASFDSDTKTFVWTPAFNQTGNYNVTFSVSDSYLTDSETISITVGNINRPPELAQIGNKQIDENSTLQFTINATDPDGDPITFSASNLPSGASFDTGTFIWTPALDQAGDYNVTFSVTDSALTDSETILITVNNLDRTPVINSKNVMIKVINATDNSYAWYVSDDSLYITYRNVTFEVNASDLDNDPLEYQWQLTGPLGSLANSAKFNYPFTTPGVYNLTLVVNDTRGGTDTTHWIINVTEPLLYGTVYDTDTGLPLPDINISAYNSSVYDVFNDTGNYSELQPKEIPDTVTDKNGNYLMAGPLAGLAQAHLVLQGSDEKDFDIYIEKGKKKRHDCNLDEDRPKTNFNAEGHILYSGKYEHKNNYTCGDKVKFVMFGVNNGDTNETITFMIGDHTGNSEKDDNIVYTGNISDSDESLTVNAGEKQHKLFEFIIPCNYSLGKYDIHAAWQGTKWHKIGNFFVVNDTTAPYVNSYPNATGYRNDTISVEFSANDPAQEGTVRAYEVSISSASSYLTLQIDKDITTDSDNDAITDNDADYITEAGSSVINLTYNKSGHYTARFTATDSSGNTAYDETNITVYITEDDADMIGDAIWTSYGFGSVLTHDYNWSVNSSTPHVYTEWDRGYPNIYFDEYITTQNGFNGPNGINLTEIAAIEIVNYGNTGPEFAKPIFSMTADEFNYTLDSFFYVLKCVGLENIPTVNCSARNFAPEIWKCAPSVAGDYLCNPSDSTITANSSQTFTTSITDPNNDAFSIYWYDNAELKQTNGTSYTFVANSSLIGNHTIKVIALDSTGENISIENGPHNSWEWKLTVTE